MGLRVGYKRAKKESAAIGSAFFFQFRANFKTARASLYPQRVHTNIQSMGCGYHLQRFAQICWRNLERLPVLGH
ncbi:MAG: hypothetical protein KBT18_05290, partial [Comamonas sp.]|nr:hypothetical protein [Candidatus Comamonas equi]